MYEERLKDLKAAETFDFKRRCEDESKANVEIDSLTTIIAGRHLDALKAAEKPRVRMKLGIDGFTRAYVPQEFPKTLPRLKVRNYASPTALEVKGDTSDNVPENLTT